MTPPSGVNDHPISNPHRVWRACERCRKRKIKCDGRDPCAACEAKSVACTFPPANDNAASNRQYLPTLEARCRRVDVLCEKVEALLDRLSGLADALDQTRAFNKSLAFHSSNFVRTELAELSKTQGHCDVDMSAPDDGGDSDHDSSSSDYSTRSSPRDHLAIDSYGRFRYVGGAPNMLLIDAVRAKLEAAEGSQEPVLSLAASPAFSTMRGKYTTAPLPFFTPGIVWPSLPYLPRPDQVPRPPRYIADLLVSLFFDQVHYTFPVLYRPWFMSQYHNLMSERPCTGTDSGFLSVFFAVCAFSAGLMDHGSGQRFPGIEYYEKAIVLHYADTGQATIEQVQCLALLSLCAARWNTLAQSWKFAGQAVRAAQDLGLHVGLCPFDDHLSKTVAHDLTRRIWWAVATLDCILSLSLGRPMVGLEPRNSCPHPVDLGDDELQSCPGDPNMPCEQTPPSTGTGPLSGFIAFARLCGIFGRIYRLCSRERHLPRNHLSARSKLLRQRQRLQKQLEGWMVNLPNPNWLSPGKLCDGSAPMAHRTMCVIISVMYSAAVIHLQGSFPGSAENANSAEWANSSQQLIQAARSCIQASELLHTNVPPSHYLAFCVHQLSLSGLLLLRTSSSRPPPPDIIEDVETCIKRLSTLEVVWPPAQCNRVILQSQLNHHAPNEMESSLREDLSCSQDAANLFSLISPGLLEFDSPLNISSFLLNETLAPGAGTQNGHPHPDSV